VGNVVRFEKDSPQLTRIRVSAAGTAAIPVDELVAPGKVELNPGRVSRVVLPVPGRIREVLVALGDSVVQGQPVVRLESQEVSAVQSALRQAQANERQGKATVAKAEADLARAKDLLAGRAIAQKEVLTAETVVAQAKAALDQAQATRDEALRKIQLLGLQPGSMDQLVTVKAPVPGKVVDVAVAPGEFRIDTTAPVLTIADLSNVWVSADVPENAIQRIAIGEPVSISLPAFPGRTFTGRVRRIGDMVDPQTRTIKVRAELPNPNGQLRPEMFATVRHSHGLKNAVVIPKAALFQEQDRTTVFREREPGVFEEVPVTVPWQDERTAAIGSGLQAGDRVVIDGVTQLRAY
jgi:cobalt-zinc-cadmium efflux system membrane fusion protein